MCLSRNILIFSFLFLFITLELVSQNSVNSTGGDIETNIGSISYSVGQASYVINDGGTGSVSQGIQQVYEIIPFNSNTNFIAYPNPTEDFVNIAVNSVPENDLYYSLFDIRGKLLLKNIKILGNPTTIFMADLPPAIYFVRIYNVLKVYQTFKIIKIK